MTKNPPNLPWDQTLEMITHWAAVPENGYLGSSYGGRTLLDSLMSNPHQPEIVARIIAKLREDVISIRSELITLNLRANNLGENFFSIVVGNCSAEIPVA